MPVYEYECPEDGVCERVSSIEQRSTGIDCPTCGRRATRIISLPIVHGFEEFFDENLCTKEKPLGQVVKSRGHQAKLLREAGLIEDSVSQRTREMQRAKKRTSISMTR